MLHFSLSYAHANKSKSTGHLHDSALTAVWYPSQNSSMNFAYNNDTSSYVHGNIAVTKYKQLAGTVNSLVIPFLELVAARCI